MMSSKIISFNFFRTVTISALSGFLLFGCATSTQQGSARSNNSSCTVNFYNDPHQSLCGWYYNGFGVFGSSCDSKIIQELERQGRSVFPRTSCGQIKPSPAVSECRRKYANSSTQAMCDVYHFNRDLGCDGSIREIFRERNLELHPRASCGGQTQSNAPAQASVCRRTVANETTASLCTLYWDNRDTACDPQLRTELIRRIGSTGNDKNSCVQLDLTSTLQACTGFSLGQLTRAQPLQLCSASSGKNDCSRLADALLLGRGLKSSQPCGEVSQDECSSLVRSLSGRADGVSEACRIKNDKNQLLGVKCRRSINGFLLGKQVSPGNASTSCGQPVKANDLAAFRVGQ
jgi:hypothetical protein